MDKKLADEVGRAALEALKPVAERFGLTVRGAGGSFYEDGGTFTPKFEFAEADANAQLFKKMAPLYGLSVDDLGRSFVKDGKTIVVTGWADTRSDRCVQVTVDGAPNKLASVELVKDGRSGIDRTAEGLKVKPGDTVQIRVSSPKYMDWKVVEVVDVNVAQQTVGVKFTDAEWKDSKARKRFGDGTFNVYASNVRPIPKPKKLTKEQAKVQEELRDRLNKQFAAK